MQNFEFFFYQLNLFNIIKKYKEIEEESQKIR
jgi:hypothetical protein